ncbi:MAG: DUF479 domain-containing protein [Flavobacterium sp.]|nr:DUF479 domain-containing protein [Flavobacterium sp.]
MNFLAHIYLSGNNELLKIGNFMADGIRGKDYLQFPEEVKKGILLHRRIDSFTDEHLIYRKSKHRLHEKYGHYSGVIMDIIYDHFLAKNWAKYSVKSLANYAEEFYKLLDKNEDLLTERTKNLLPYMKLNNWLLSYQSIEGIEKILFQMNHRTKNRSNMQEAIVELKLFYPETEEEFTQFFDELQLYVAQQLLEL